jgi:hypothetical protein
VAKLALRAPKVAGGAGPPPEEYYRDRKATLAAAPLPLPPPAPKVEVDTGRPRSQLAILARWAGPRLLALLASAVGGGVAAPAITGNVGRVEAHDVELANTTAELRALRTRLATLETERATDRAIAAKQAAYNIRLWRELGNAEIRISDKTFPALPALEIQIPTDERKRAQVATPFPTE